MLFETIFRESEIILTEGALVERLKAEFSLKMDRAINHAGFIYKHPDILETLYNQYITVGVKHDLPVMVMTPTRKVNSESLRESECKDRNVIRDSCAFLNKIRDKYETFSEKILIGGLLGCKGDAYSGEKVLNTNEAYHFHKQQTSQFSGNGIDFLFAGIMPEINEAIGMAQAMAETGMPYIISFMIQKDGCLLDGTALSEAIRVLDERVNPKPVCYMTNCIHPANLIEALMTDKNKNSIWINRFKGIQANASPLSCDDLNGCNVLQQDDFENIADKMVYLKKQSGLKIFGGCCGTDAIFMELLATKLTDNLMNT